MITSWESQRCYLNRLPLILSQKPSEIPREAQLPLSNNNNSEYNACTLGSSQNLIKTLGCHVDYPSKYDITYHLILAASRLIGSSKKNRVTAILVHVPERYHASQI